MADSRTAEIIIWPTASRDGWLVCDGSAVSRTTYSALFAIISTTYGAGDGSTTFNLPNLKGKVPVGFDSAQTEFDTLAETGGAKTHTLTSAEMPAHTHTQNSHNHTQDAHNHLERATSTATGNFLGIVSDASSGGTGGSPGSVANMAAGFETASTTATNQAATATNQNTGGDGAHNNLQPYIVLYYLIKY